MGYYGNDIYLALDLERNLSLVVYDLMVGLGFQPAPVAQW